MSIKIALAGNPNCGKTTLFNNLTGSNQYVGNWPGVTVEKKEGKLKGDKDVIIQDLPGIYSLSPYTLEEVVSRTYLVKEKPDAILNIIDGTNIERNLYLTTQLIELGIPVVMAVNMIDLVRKNGDKIDLKKLSAELGCQAVEISALKGEGTEAAAKAAVAAAKAAKTGELPHVFTGSVEHAIAHIEESIQGKVDDRFLRWYAVKLFERDDKVQDELKLDKTLMDHIDEHIQDCEKEMDDDAESIITNQRYAYINTVVGKAVKKKARVEHLTVSLGAFHLCKSGCGAGGHLIWQGIDLSQGRRKQLRRPLAVCAAGIVKGDNAPAPALAARAGGVGVEGQMKIVAAGVALPDGIGHGAPGIVAGKLDAVGKQQRLHGVRQQVHEVFLTAGAGDILVIFLGRRA